MDDLRSTYAFIASCVLAAVAQFAPGGSVALPEFQFPGWPATFQGRILTESPLTDRERTFESGFPGRIGKFTDGKHTIVVRWVTQPTRKLHPAADCLKGSGYTVKPLPLRKDSTGALWTASQASRQDEVIDVEELIQDDRGASMPDVSAWYWKAAIGNARGPWWAITVLKAH
ncbi:MAG: hypothetical protein HY912_05185 [Desulfomonile tiedjei]|uniref:Uncharacterized protein n=1 Tax=Desulfomonile tiedjei TaxID=2358 RepID=A0A9D6V196_9BACT|nr:hypothetical protein [Desulfomonile tiedjei]